MPTPAPRSQPHAAVSWRLFAQAFAGAGSAVAAGLYLFVLALDPYGLRAAPGRPPGPIMDLNQRFMYPQIVRSGRFDAAVFGTSTIRLLDPSHLNRMFGARFANLGLNAGTPWEQIRLAELFLRLAPAPRALIFGLDTTWCEADADAPGKRITFRAFPPWLYDDDPLNDFAGLFNFRSIEIAGRVALKHLGLMPERIRGDGYERFVPDDATYDLARARIGPPRVGQAPPPRLSPEEERALRFPALPWLDALLARVPREAAITLAFMPIHVSAQPTPGSAEAARDAACKARIAEIGRRRGAAVIDFRYPSPVTTEDSNYWDPLHYRIGIAERVGKALRNARVSGRDDPEGFYRVLVPPATN